MMSDLPDHQKPEILDDDIQASSAPLLSHLNELRRRLIIMIVALTGAAFACFFLAEPLYNILLKPLVREAQIMRGLTDFELIYTAPLEVFFVRLKLAMFLGLFVSFPVIAWQVYAFVAPGLYRNEKHAFMPFLIAAPVLFVLGACFVYFGMLPLLSRFALGFEQIGGSGIAAIVPQIKVSEYLSLVMALMIAFGLSFQLPVILSLCAVAGLVSSDMLASGRKYALVGILAAAAVFTPPDIISQIMLTAPVYGLYEISIWISRRIERRAQEA